MNILQLNRQLWGKPTAHSKACCYCEVVVPRSEITSEHIIPKSKGGRITAPCCRECNWQKKDMLLIDFIIMLMGHRKQMRKNKSIKKCDRKIANAVKFLLLLYPLEYDFIFKTNKP